MHLSSISFWFLRTEFRLWVNVMNWRKKWECLSSTRLDQNELTYRKFDMNNFHTGRTMFSVLFVIGPNLYDAWNCFKIIKILKSILFFYKSWVLCFLISYYIRVIRVFTSNMSHRKLIRENRFFGSEHMFHFHADDVTRIFVM